MSEPGRILLLGVTGQVGRELQRSFAGKGELICCDRGQVDFADAAQVRGIVRASAPDIILNAAAYTAVDRAESERELANAVNAVAPRILAEEARRQDALLVHYSTDYVFDGTKSGEWVETDRPNPLNHYGASKLAGEQAVAEVGGKYLIFRTSWVYGPYGNNFLLTMLRLGRERERLSVVADQIGAPTSAAALADATFRIVQGVMQGAYAASEGWAGLYHMTCGGSTSWCGFAREIFRRFEELNGQRSPEVVPIASDAWPTPAARPRNSVLCNDRLDERFGVRLADWKIELDRVLSEVARNLNATRDGVPVVPAQ